MRVRVPASRLLVVGLLGGSGVAPAEDPELGAQKRVEEGRLVAAKARQLD